LIRDRAYPRWNIANFCGSNVGGVAFVPLVCECLMVRRRVR
jgi:hypothetical protein